jgi:hypothetical protein
MGVQEGQIMHCRTAQESGTVYMAMTQLYLGHTPGRVIRPNQMTVMFPKRQKGACWAPGLIRHLEVTRPLEVLGRQGFLGSQGLLDP